jgi:hypothetical protein
LGVLVLVRLQAVVRPTVLQAVGVATMAAAVLPAVVAAAAVRAGGHRGPVPLALRPS